MSPPKQTRPNIPSSVGSSSSSGSNQSPTNPITFSHFADIQSAPPPPVKKEPDVDSEFKVSFQFVGSQDARKATTENRSHVMREYRRKQRWEQEQKKKKQQDQSDPKEPSDQEDKSADHGDIKSEHLDLAKVVSIGRAAGKLPPKRKLSLEDSETGRESFADFDSATSNVAMQILAQLTGPQVNHPSHESPILDVFTQRFVDNFAPQARNAGAATAIRSIANVRNYSPLLTNACNAVSTTFAGQQVQDKAILNTGRDMYTAVLKQLQSALADPLYSRSEAVLATVVLCVAYESMQHTTPEALAKHCMGALQLIEYRGPHAHVHGLEHLCFSELRPYWAFAAIVFRTPTFLQEPEWKTIPWSGPDATKDIMQHLLDHIVDLPSILFQSDNIKKASAEGSSSEHELAAVKQTLWMDIAGLFERLSEWRQEHADVYHSGPPIDAKAPLGKEPFPIFHSRNPRTGAILNPPSIVYPDPQLCRTLCTSYATLIVLSSVDSRPQPTPEVPESPWGSPVKPIQMFGWASLICRSVEYFVRNVPGNMTNRMMFPLRAAWEVMPAGGPEREFLTGVWQEIGKRKVSTVWTKLTKADEDESADSRRDRSDIESQK